MSLSDLQSVLQGQASGPGGAVTVAASTLTAAGLQPSAHFDATIQSGLCLSGPLLVTPAGAIPPPSGDTLTLTGKASFLGLAGAQVTAVFTETDGTVDLLLSAAAGDGWSFATSFPLLTGFPFDGLTLTGAEYLLTTAAQAAYTYSGQPLALGTGLSLAATLGLGGALGILKAFIDTLAPGDTIVLSGPVDPTGIRDLATGTPVLGLIGSIAQPITGSTGFNLGAPQVLLSSAPDPNGHLAYWLTFGTTLSVGSVPFCQFQATILSGTSLVRFAALPTKNPITPDEIATLLGGTAFAEHIPPPLQSVFSSVGLRALSATIDTKTMTALALHGEIGTTGPPWTMGQFSLLSLAMGVQVLSPSAPSRQVLVTFTAQAQIFPKVFNGPFDFELGYDVTGKGLAIAANFRGTVGIDALVRGLSDDEITIPENLLAITFDDFGMTFTEAGERYDYTLYGRADATFGVTIAGKPVQADFEISVASASSTYVLHGGLTLGGSYFQATVDLSGQKQVLTGSWSALGDDYLGLNDILSDLGLETAAPPIPSDLDLALESASITWDITGHTFLITAKSATYGAAALAIVESGAGHDFYFLLGVAKTFSLSDLPLVGKQLAAIESVQVGSLEVILASEPAKPAIAETINGLLNSAAPGGGYPQMPAAGTTTRMELLAQLTIGSQEPVPLALALGRSTSTSIAGAAAPQPLSEPSPDGTTWLDVQRSFGPVSIQRIGALYQPAQQTLWFEIDATLAVGPLSLSLDGLAIGSPLSSFSPQFSLAGAGVSYASPPLQIAGSLVNLAPPGADYVELEGGVTIGTGEATLTAFGFYGDQGGVTSMFLFGDLAHDFGGPPAFFVTGLALGFGYNSALRRPTIDDVGDFPFLQVLPTSFVPSTGVFGGPNPTPQKVLDVVMKTQPPWVAPKPGALWFAAGITFTSFELVNSQALAIIEPGDDLVISLVGTSRAQFPQATDRPPYAYIELDLDVVLAPTQGVFSAEAVLAKSSFLLDKACALTGGFAFFVWFGDNPHAGDFVLTLGGYHAGFRPPPHYPVVPRVGFHWSLDASIDILGDAYFALTPAALMVGGELRATYQSGNLSAWFDAHADIIVQWKPFWIDARIGLTVGASYRVDLAGTSFTASVELGCDLELWGPPTGGQVKVHWNVISFTIPFGAEKSEGPGALTQWSDVQAMLPNSGTADSPSLITLAPSSGLFPATTSPGGGAGRADDAGPAPWVVRGGQFGFTTSSSVPASSVTVGAAHSFAGRTFNVAPLGWTGIAATHEVTITDANGADWSPAFSAVPTTRSLPSQLWGTQSSRTPSGHDQLVPNQLVGVELMVNPPEPGGSAGPVDVEVNLATVNLAIPDAVLPISSTATPSGDVPANSPSTLATIADPTTGIASQHAISARSSIFAALTTLGYAPGTTNDTMTQFAQEIGSALCAEPLLVA